MSLHPSVATVRVAVRRTLAALVAEQPGRGLPPDAAVLVACSGGPDSLALLSATVFEGHKLGLRVIGVTVDHGLQEESAAHAEHVVAQMAELGCRRDRHRPGRGAGRRSRDRRRRRARRGTPSSTSWSSTSVRSGCSSATPSTTRPRPSCSGLARGSGGRSLAGMRRGFDHYRRPLLDVTRTDTVTACQVEGIEYWNDPHNIDPTYSRVRVRRKVLPVLEDELGPGVAGALARTADQLRADMELLDHLAQSAYDELHDSDDEPGLEVEGASPTCRSPPATACSGWPRSRPGRSPPSCSTCTSWRWPSFCSRRAAPAERCSCPAT